MQMRYLGDSFDIVKQSMLRWLKDFGEWKVHPMFTQRVSVAEVNAFERLLGARAISTEVLGPKTDRCAYFACASSCGNIFLDPDTGLRIRPIRGALSTKFLFVEDLLEITENRPRSLTLIFDQSVPRGGEFNHLGSKLQELHRRSLFGFAYASHACFILVGGNRSLVAEARERVARESGLPERRFLPVSGA